MIRKKITQPGSLEALREEYQRLSSQRDHLEIEIDGIYRRMKDAFKTRFGAPPHYASDFKFLKCGGDPPAR